MTERRPAVVRFVLLALSIAGLSAAVGWVPTHRLAGPSGVTAMLIGIGVSLTASLLALAPVARASAADPATRGRAVWLAMGVRFGAALLLALAVALAGRVARGPFLVWVALSYLPLLVADSLFAAQTLRPVAAGPQQNFGG